MNLIQEISALSRDHVKIKNPDRLNEILNDMIKGGVDQLQVVSDFDRTITKQHENGVPHLSSFGNLRNISEVKYSIHLNIFQQYLVEYPPH